MTNLLFRDKANEFRICREFAKRGSCRFDPCRFAHALDGESSNASTEKELIKRSQAREFSAWKRNVSIDQRFRPLNPLQFIFTEARKLIDFDEDTLQNVIRALAEEAGLRRVQQLVEQNFEALQAPTKKMVFLEMIVPFLEIVTASNALTSLILEQSIVTIYNCIFGPVGRRGTPFLCFLADFLTLEMETGGVVEVAHLELSLHTFSNIVEFNSTAFIDESLKPIIAKFSSLVEKLQSSQSAYSLNQSHCYLAFLNRRLNMGVSLSKQVDNATRHLELLSPPSHMIERKAPGGRHDNDHSNICDIDIMPTFEEINCARSEYLPVKDPRQWHLDGLAGLLDRNFRLLREDMIGQLRDVIYAELHPSINTNTSNQA